LREPVPKEFLLNPPSVNGTCGRTTSSWQPELGSRSERVCAEVIEVVVACSDLDDHKQ